MTLSIIASVTLSLVSTNDYTFTVPGTTNIIGVGMGKTPSYAIVRGEDISFLREAYEERIQAVRGKDVTFGGMPQTNDYVVSGDMDVGNPFLLAYLLPESFNPSDGGWRQYRMIYRGKNNSFVSEDFHLISGGYTPVQCSTNWVFALFPGEDCRASYLPFVDWDTRILPPDDLKTNTMSSVLTLQAVTNGYHNIELMHDIVTSPSSGGEEVSAGHCLYGPISATNLIQRNYSGISATYSYTQYDYQGSTYAYVSGYASRTSYNQTMTPYNWTRTSSSTPLASSSWAFSDTYTSRIGWKRTGPQTFERKTVLEPYHSQLLSESETPVSFATVKAFCPLITTNVASLCSSVCAMAICGIRRSVTEISYSMYEQSDKTTSKSSECGITAVPVNISPSGEITSFGANDGVVVWATDLDVKRVLDEAAQYFGEPVSTVTPIQPKTWSVPETTTSPSDNLHGYHGYVRSITLDWIRFIFRFKRDFRAKIIEE